MADKKRKARDETKQVAARTKKDFKGKSSSNKNMKGDKGKKRKSGPRLPNAFRRELDLMNHNNEYGSEEDEDILSDEGNDFYEYEEEVAEEESKKNRRYDHVENYEYELPEKFKDENVQSDDDDDDNELGKRNVRRNKLDQHNDDFEEEDNERHITGIPTEAFKGKKKDKKNIVISEAYPESEYNPTRDILDGSGLVTMDDLLGSLQEKPEYHKLRKRTHQMERKTAPLNAPLAKPYQDKVERKAAYELSKKDITKWEPLVKRNREAPTIIFDKDIDLGFSTVGAIASEFEPRTEFEKKMASLVHDDEVMEAHKEDGARLLELNKISADDIKDRWNHIAKMRSLLFRHEMKMKRVKKIKSKVYRRMLKKDRLKMSADELHMDPEAAKELAMKQEFKRAEERMTLKHKNRSKWARRIMERGLDVQDEGTKAAVAEQLQQHALLTRKMKSRDSSSDDTSDEEEDEDSGGSEHGEPSKMLTKAKEKTLKVLEEDDEVPNSGVLSLPFMMRGLKKKKEAAVEEAKLALQEYESSLQQLEGTTGAENVKAGSVSGRRVFGASKPQVAETSNKVKTDNSYDSSESEDELLRDKGDNDMDLSGRNGVQKDVNVKEGDNEVSVFKSSDDFVEAAGPKTTYEVSIFVSDTWKKMTSQNKGDPNIKRSSNVVEPVKQIQDEKAFGEESDTDSEGHMVDGILSSGPKSSYQLPSQAELIREAFAGDDVEEEFSKDKEELLNVENPEPEKPLSLPGWGQWASVQKKKGLPSWMVEEHEMAKKKRADALKKRKDAHLKNVIISEKLDKKAEKLHTKTLPYPFTSKEVYEQSIRMPIGPEFNPATAVGALNRPEVLKRQGLIIKPIKYEDVDPYEREEHNTNKKKSGQTQTNKSKIKKKIWNKLKPVVAKS